MKLRAPTESGSVSVGGREYPIENGFVEVSDAAAVAVLRESHGFRDPHAPAPAQKPKVEAGKDTVAIPRSDLLANLKALGIVIPPEANVANDKLIEALREGCARQDERVKHEIDLAEQRGEQRALETLTKHDSAPASSAPPAPPAPPAPAPEPPPGDGAGQTDSAPKSQ
jgi:hypothetical protein